MAKKVQRKQIRVNDLDIHYLTGGEGEPLVVIHGGGGRGSSAWWENVEALSEDYTVYAPDLPGFGRSQEIVGNYNIPEMVDFVDRFSHELGLEKFHLMGHSLGGGIAVSYALKFPLRITKLVLVSSLCLGKELALWMRFLSVPAICRSLGRAVLAVLKSVKWVVELLLAPFEFILPVNKASMDLGCVTAIREHTAGLMGRLSEIAVPTLLVWGDRDPIVPASQAYAAAQVIPDCQVRVYSGCGHNVYRQKLAEFSKLLRKFLG